MASRGGRGGRGRGRFGGNTSAAQLYLKRSAQESGLDDRNLTTLQDITRPALFPDFVFHSSGRPLDPAEVMAAATTTTVNVPLSQPVRTPSTLYLMQKGRDLQHRIQSSSNYVRLTSAVDVIRYGKQTAPVHADEAFLQDCSAAYRTDHRYLPRELLSKEPATKKPRRAAPLLDELLDGTDEALPLSPSHVLGEKVDNEDDDPAAPKKIKVEGEEEENLSDSGDLEVEEEEEEGEDYTTNYYESADEGSDGGGGGDGGDEAVF